MSIEIKVCVKGLNNSTVEFINLHQSFQNLLTSIDFKTLKELHYLYMLLKLPPRNNEEPYKI